MFAFTTSIRGPTPCNSQEKERKNKQMRKEAVKLSLFVNDMIAYVEKHNKSSKKLLKLITWSSSIVRYVIVSKSIYFYKLKMMNN